MKIQVNFQNGKSLYLKNFEDITYESTEPITESDTFVTVKFQWGDKIVSATQDIVVYSISAIPDNLNDCTWAQISYLSQHGLFENYFSVGDTKTIVLNGPIGEGFIADNLAIDLVVVGINHNAEREGKNLVHFMLGQIDGVNVALTENAYMTQPGAGYFVINPTHTNAGGWLSSAMRRDIMGGEGTPDSPVAKSLMSALPQDLLSVMRPAKKWTDNVGGGNSTSNITETLEYLCLIDEYENAGTTEYANTHVTSYQQQYEYFKTLSKPWNFNNAIKSSNDICAYYRGPSTYDTNFWDGVQWNGNSDFLSPEYSRGIATLLFV